MTTIPADVSRSEAGSPKIAVGLLLKFTFIHLTARPIEISGSTVVMIGDGNAGRNGIHNADTRLSHLCMLLC